MIPIRDTIVCQSVPLMVRAIVAVNVGVFLFELSVSDEQQEWLFYIFGLVPARYAHPRWAQWAGLPAHEYWPFLTSMFLQGGWLHLVGNMWTLWIFGDNVEDRMGHGRFLVFYLLCGLLAGILHYMTNLNSTVPTVGASGAIAGVMGAYTANNTMALNSLKSAMPRIAQVSLSVVMRQPTFQSINALRVCNLGCIVRAHVELLSIRRNVHIRFTGGVEFAHTASVWITRLFLSLRQQRERDNDIGSSALIFLHGDTAAMTGDQHLCRRYTPALFGPDCSGVRAFTLGP